MIVALHRVFGLLRAKFLVQSRTRGCGRAGATKNLETFFLLGRNTLTLFCKEPESFLPASLI